MRSKSLTAGGVFVLVFENGDDVLTGLIEFAKVADIEGAFFSGVGAFQQATIGFFDLSTKAYLHIPIDEQVEVMSLAGNISRIEGKPKIHCHVVLGKRDGTALGGHLIDGVVRPTLEVFLNTTETRLTRKIDESTNLPLIDLID